ncbi:MAG TPA: N-acetylmuramic acid 6-phosphate etherase [Candidatus Saccharimonadales bacterium]|nr:N-acetylmuramic acid 6-phosphate etherase [Candidatus Saccharimonadales bacterium]
MISSRKAKQPMPPVARLSTQQFYLGIEGGGTRTVALLTDADGRLVKRAEFGPANFRLLNDAELRKHLQTIAAAFPIPKAVAVGLAGARTLDDRNKLGAAIRSVWSGVAVYATNDLETALMAARSTTATQLPRVLVLSGTGSCCFGRAADGKTVKVGGWGHILGDKGSGFEIALRGLKASVYYYDRDGVWPRLGERILAALLLNAPDDLIGWIQTASKSQIAAVAKEVFAAAAEKDRIARDILKGAAHTLAQDAITCARRLGALNQTVEFVFSGSVLLNQPGFRRTVQRLIQRECSGAVHLPLTRESAWGAVELARNLPDFSVRPDPKAFQRKSLATADAFPPLKKLTLSPTEQRNPRSRRLDKMPLAEAIRLMLREDAQITEAIGAHRKEIEQVIRWIVQAFRGKGRLFYVGAGTSGRLGVLDASECPPTFRTPPELVQGIIAGGQVALWQAVEGAEDDPAAGAKAAAFRGIRKNDVLVGIAASGRTPFVWGALRDARERGAKTVLLCFNPKFLVPKGYRPHRVIAVDVGPEVLTGSTRLKSGTATKMILNMFTTLAMVRIGKVMSNLMIDVKASNTKLRDRATRIVVELTGANYEKAEGALQRVQWDIKRACRVLQRR